MADQTEGTTFHVGDRVTRKDESDYAFDSVVVSVFKQRDGAVRMVCESVVVKGLVRIFEPTEMRKVDQ